MTPERWQQIRVLFDEVLDQPAEHRAALLDVACADDPELRAEVEAMLQAEAEASLRLDAPIDHMAGDLVGAMRAAGRQVGPYRLLREIGRGGMSVVYLAERDVEDERAQFEQRVALKLIGHGLDSDQVLNRFLNERQILARLQHPHIARLYDGGLDPDGRPYFAMELVDGQPITTYCDERNLDLNARLELFETVCDAVQYAHRNLVVHRDLKPSNVLVSTSGEVKLLDFGISKVLGDEGEAELTRTGERWMTPEYAAPEQVRGEPITTATDVYALGVVLYVLLTGQRPYESTGRTMFELERMICHEQPKRPATVNPRLAGDLDAIIMTALRKEPERRYASAAALGKDIERYRTGRPVTAQPDTLGYRMTKFVRRHRASVAAAALVVLSLVSGLTVAVWQAQVARQERDAKQIEATRASTMLNAMVGMFEDLDPFEAQGRTFTAQDLLTPGLRQLDDLRDQPQEYAAVARQIGQIAVSLAQPELADSLLTEALTLQEDLLDPNDVELAATLELQAELYATQIRYDRAQTVLERALAIRRQAFETRGSPELIKTLNQLAYSYLYQDLFDAAEELFREVLALRDHATKSLYQELPRSRRGLAEARLRAGDPESAAPLYRQALIDYRGLLGEDHSEVARTLLGLAQALQGIEAFTQADSLLQASLVTTRRVYGDEHPEVANVLTNLGDVWKTAGDVQQAEAYYRNAAVMYEQVLSEPTLYKAFAFEKLGALQLRDGRPKEAVVPLNRAHELYQVIPDPERVHLPRVRVLLAACHARSGDDEAAYALLLENHQDWEALSTTSPDARVVQTQTLRGLIQISERLGRTGDVTRFQNALEAHMSTEAVHE